MARYRWITLDELTARRAAWDRLSSEGDFPTVFAGPSWVLSWWATFGDGQQPWTFIEEDHDGELCGLAALALQTSSLTRTLRFAGGDWNGFDAPLCRAGGEAAFDDALIDALHERRAEWDLLRIQRLRTDSALARTLLGNGSRLRAAAHDLRMQPFLELPGDMEAFEARFGSKQRKRRRWMMRKLSELGAEARVVEDLAEIEPTLRELVAQRRARALTQGQRHQHMEDRYEQFLLAVVSDLMPDGVRLWRLDLDGRMLASRLNFVAGPREHSYLIGLGEEHANLSPGNALELQAIAAAIEQGRTELELGPGRDSYKYKLGACDREVARLVASSGTARGRAVTGLAAVNLRLRDSAAAEALRRRKGVTSERARSKQPVEPPPVTQPPAPPAPENVPVASPSARPPRASRPKQRVRA
jgi:CelD/BcsL family acetyltransferase involved in cellulose biosynthesis